MDFLKILGEVKGKEYGVGLFKLSTASNIYQRNPKCLMKLKVWVKGMKAVFD